MKYIINYKFTFFFRSQFTMFGSPHITCLPSQTTQEQIEEVINILINKYNVSNSTSNEIVITDSSVSIETISVQSLFYTHTNFFLLILIITIKLLNILFNLCPLIQCSNPI